MKLLCVALVIIGYLAKCEGVVSQAQLDITLVVFSGRPDPQWTINPSSTQNYQGIKDMLDKAKTNGATKSPEKMAARLGYRGFLLSENAQELSILIFGDQTKELQKLLLKTAPQSIKGSLTETILKSIEEEQKNGQEIFITKRAAPVYNAGYWNGIAYRRKRNNCYNYANDKITDTFAQPGKGSGKMFAQITNQELIDASKRDGLIWRNPIQNVPKQYGDWNIVALFIWPDKDFHWYRLDSNEFWSHKPGRSRATNLDYKGYPIIDPENSASGPYQFVCFMTTNKKFVKID